MIDLLALADIERETEISYIRKERDWAERAAAEGRLIPASRLLPVLPASLASASRPDGGRVPALTAGQARDAGNGHGNGTGAPHAHHR
jgi:hypothetical protein